MRFVKGKGPCTYYVTLEGRENFIFKTSVNCPGKLTEGIPIMIYKVFQRVIRCCIVWILEQCMKRCVLQNQYAALIKQVRNFKSMQLLSTIYACSQDINPLDDFPILHISMTQQKPSSKTYFPPGIHFDGTFVFLLFIMLKNAHVRKWNRKNPLSNTLTTTYSLLVP